MSFIKDTFFGGAEKKAADIQAQYGREAIDAQKQALERSIQQTQPFAQAGGSVLQDLVGAAQGGDSSVERSNIIRDVQNTAAAGGKLFSGGTVNELGRQLYGLQERDRSLKFNRLFNLATLGANAASGQATGILGTGQGVSETTQGIGNVLGAGKIGAANATRGTFNSLLEAALRIAGK